MHMQTRNKAEKSEGWLRLRFAISAQGRMHRLHRHVSLSLQKAVKEGGRPSSQQHVSDTKHKIS